MNISQLFFVLAVVCSSHLHASYKVTAWNEGYVASALRKISYEHSSPRSILTQANIIRHHCDLPGWQSLDQQELAALVGAIQNGLIALNCNKYQDRFGQFCFPENSSD